MNNDARPSQPSTPPNASVARPGPDRAGRIRLVIAVAAIIGIVSLVGVLIIRPGPFSSHRTPTASVSAAPPRAPDDRQVVRELSVGVNGGDLDALDPAYIAYGSDYDRAQLVFPELIGTDAAGKPVDWAARSHEISADGLTWTFHLHDGMHWSDGAPIDANTFAYSINRTLDPCTKSGSASYLYNIKSAAEFNSETCPEGAKASDDTLIGRSIVVVDRLTLRLTLGAPAVYFPGTLSYPSSWGVPKQLIDQYGEQWTEHLADGKGFGGNLYKVVRWDHGRRFELAANSAFWGQKPIIQRIEYMLYKDQSTAWSDYQVGVGDVAFPPPNDVALARTLGGYTASPTLGVFFLNANWALAPFDDVRVRNAFSLAIDRKAMVTAIDKGGATPTIHMIIQGVPGYNPGLKNAAGDSGDQTLTANLTKARELAGAYAAEKCAGNFAKCAPIVYTYPSELPAEQVRAQVLQQEWQTAFPGWPITLQSLSIRVLFKTMSRLQFAWGGWGADYADPQDFTSVLWSKDSGFNQTSVDVPEADALERQADASTDATGRLAQYQQAEQLLIDQGAFMAISQRLLSYVVRPAAKLEKWRISIMGLTALPTWQQAYIAA
jgi:oligopeptide transport system substrate-binding protein